MTAKHGCPHLVTSAARVQWHKLAPCELDSAELDLMSVTAKGFLIF